MDKKELIGKLEAFVAEDSGNFISAADAIDPALAGMRIYDAPLVGFASAEDALFVTEFKKPQVISPAYKAPGQWLPGARTVISFFLPFTEEVKASNRCREDEPYEAGLPQRASAQWLHARIEGQIFMDRAALFVQELLRAEGFEAMSPTASGKLEMLTPFISNWSERHAAYAAGLGTFGLSKGLITEKGMAGRFGSVITDAEFAPTVRPYSAPFEYCIMCAACMNRCPAGAIDREKGCALGKDQTVCAPYVAGSRLPPHGPNQRSRYGCGKCQVGVPCESCIPGKK